MNVAKQTNSPSIRNKKQKCGLVPLVRLLLNNGKEFTGSYIKKLVELLTIEKMSSLLTTCKDIYQAAEIILYYAPKVWENDHEVRKIFVAMTETPNSRWMTSWIDTKKVEQIVLGSNSSYQKTSVVTDKRFKRFIEQFPRLTSINISCCGNITDASVIEIAKGCSQLTSIDLYKVAGILRMQKCKWNGSSQAHRFVPIYRHQKICAPHADVNFENKNPKRDFPY